MIAQNFIIFTLAAIASVAQANSVNALPAGSQLKIRDVSNALEPVEEAQFLSKRFAYADIGAWAASTVVVTGAAAGIEKCGAKCLQCAGINYEAKIGAWLAKGYNAVVKAKEAAPLLPTHNDPPKEITKEEALAAIKKFGWKLQEAVKDAGLTVVDPKKPGESSKDGGKKDH